MSFKNRFRALRLSEAEWPDHFDSFKLESISREFIHIVTDEVLSALQLGRSSMILS